MWLLIGHMMYGHKRISEFSTRVEALDALEELRHDEEYCGYTLYFFESKEDGE